MVDIKRVEELMQEREWDWRELAKRAEISYDTLWSIKAGRRKNTSSATLTKLARALGTTPNDLLLDANGAKQEEATPPAIRQLADIAGRLSEVRREELLRIAATLESVERAHPIPTVDMSALLRIERELNAADGNEELIAFLRALVGKLPRRWLIDLSDGSDTSEQPPDNPGEGE